MLSQITNVTYVTDMASIHLPIFANFDIFAWLMPHVTASSDQFVLHENEVVHVPTGAWWRARQHEALFCMMGMEGLGSALSNGDEYDSNKVQELALMILRGRLPIN